MSNHESLKFDEAVKETLVKVEFVEVGKAASIMNSPKLDEEVNQALRDRDQECFEQKNKLKSQEREIESLQRSVSELTEEQDKLKDKLKSQQEDIYSLQKEKETLYKLMGQKDCDILALETEIVDLKVEMDRKGAEHKLEKVQQAREALRKKESSAESPQEPPKEESETKETTVYHPNVNFIGRKSSVSFRKGDVYLDTTHCLWVALENSSGHGVRFRCLDSEKVCSFLPNGEMEQKGLSPYVLKAYVGSNFDLPVLRDGQQNAKDGLSSVVWDMPAYNVFLYLQIAARDLMIDRGTLINHWADADKRSLEIEKALREKQNETDKLKAELEKALERNEGHVAEIQRCKETLEKQTVSIVKERLDETLEKQKPSLNFFAEGNLSEACFRSTSRPRLAKGQVWVDTLDRLWIALAPREGYEVQEGQVWMRCLDSAPNEVLLCLFSEDQEEHFEKGDKGKAFALAFLLYFDTSGALEKLFNEEEIKQGLQSASLLVSPILAIRYFQRRAERHLRAHTDLEGQTRLQKEELQRCKEKLDKSEKQASYLDDVAYKALQDLDKLKERFNKTCSKEDKTKAFRDGEAKGRQDALKELGCMHIFASSPEMIQKSNVFKFGIYRDDKNIFEEAKNHLALEGEVDENHPMYLGKLYGLSMADAQAFGELMNFFGLSRKRLLDLSSKLKDELDEKEEVLVKERRKRAEFQRVATDFEGQIVELRAEKKALQQENFSFLEKINGLYDRLNKALDGQREALEQELALRLSLKEAQEKSMEEQGQKFLLKEIEKAQGVLTALVEVEEMEDLKVQTVNTSTEKQSPFDTQAAPTQPAKETQATSALASSKSKWKATLEREVDRSLETNANGPTSALRALWLLVSLFLLGSFASVLVAAFKSLF